MDSDIFDEIHHVWDQLLNAGNPKDNPIQPSVVGFFVPALGEMDQRKRSTQALGSLSARPFSGQSRPAANAGKGFAVDVVLDPSRVRDLRPNEGPRLRLRGMVKAGRAPGVTAATRKRAKLQKRFANSRSASQGY